jgi:hypothetical protein
MKPYPNFRDLEIIHGLSWRELVELEPQLAGLLWLAREASLNCHQKSDVIPAFTPIRNKLSELVGFAGKNHQHPVLGSVGAFEVAYWRLYDAVSGLLPCRADSNEAPAKQQRLTVPESRRWGVDALPDASVTGTGSGI